MSSGDARAPSAQRRRLGAELRRFRELAGISGRTLAGLVGMSQSRVSRIEAGATTPSMPDVLAWAAAVRASPDNRDRLMALTEAAFTELRAWRTELEAKPHLQQRAADREVAARVVRVFQPFLVPGLLQTAEYARQVFALFEIPYSAEDLAHAVTARMDRQLILFDQARRFTFLITEWALRWRPGPLAMLRAQWDRILSLSTLDNVTIGIVPLDAPANTVVPEGFEIYDGAAAGDTVVAVETVHAGLTVTNRDDIALYERVWSLLGEMALFDADSRSYLTTMADTLGADL
jgi:transcriptional regulator with XRE-family HTH domain